MSETSEVPEVRDVIPLPVPVAKRFAARHHRLHHAVWHGVRQAWNGPDLDDRKRAEIRRLGWEPPRPAMEYDGTAVSRPAVTNGSGEDFLFMHRQMIAEFRAAMRAAGASPDVGWVSPPVPGVPAGSGFAVPPVWTVPDDPALTRRLRALKGDDYFWSRMRWWDREFKDSTRLRAMTLGELGAIVEFSIHNDMHMRWSSLPRDPQTGDPVPGGRPDWDFSEKWDAVSYDYLGEFYSSHVNPVFWRLHGWVDARVEDWFAAHREADPGEVRRTAVGGVSWFAPGRWVVVGDPWSAPPDSGGHGHHDHDAEQAMLDVLRILFPAPGPEPAGAALSPARPSHRSWFGAV